MLRPLAICATVVASLLVFSIQQPPAQEPTSAQDQKKEQGPLDSKDWKPLFNQKDLINWSKFPEDYKAWAVVGKFSTKKGESPARIGDLVCRYGEQTSYLVREGDFESFHLRMEVNSRVKAGSKGSSALYFRSDASTLTDRVLAPRGYKVQINSSSPDHQQPGSLDQFSEFHDVLVSEGTWFKLEVVALGNHIIIRVNDLEAVNYVDFKNTYSKGRIVLENGPDTLLYVRKMEVKVLPPTPAFKPIF